MACDRYPPSANILHTGNKYEDCYNNAILFTDYFIGEVANVCRAAHPLCSIFQTMGWKKPAAELHLYAWLTQPKQRGLPGPQFIWYSQQALNAQKDRWGGCMKRGPQQAIMS
jgi:hypothetical protein